MKRKSCLILIFFLFVCFNKIVAQTYCYQYLYSVKDEMKIPGIITKGNLFYFTFTEDKSRCYSTDQNGVYRCEFGQESYQYIGEKNGVYIYKECNQNMFRVGQNVLYFSSDFKRLNWRCMIDDYSPNLNDHGCLRVLNYIKDPNAIDVPSQLY